MAARHRLLERQLRSAMLNGILDVENLLQLVDEAYCDFDTTFQRTQHALVVMSEELTETNQALRDETLRLRQFYDYAASSADIGLWELNIPNAELDCTDGFKQLVGYSDQLGKTVIEYVNSSFPRLAIETFREAVVSSDAEKNRLIQFRTPLYRGDGKEHWVLIQGRVVQRDAKTLRAITVAGTLADITDQVEHERALEKLNQLSAEVDLKLKDRCNEVIEMLRKVIGMDFVRVNRVVDDKLVVTFSSGDKTCIPMGVDYPLASSLCAQLVNGPDSLFSINHLEIEGFADHPARKVFGIESYLGAKIVVQGKTYGSLCLTAATPTNVSDLNRNLLRETARWLGGQIELEQSKESLTEAHNNAVDASRAKSDFLATMSHEIRTPLNGIMSLVELLQEAPVNPTQRMQLDTVQRSCSTLLTVISDILDFSKIEAGKIDLEYRTFDLTTAIKDVVDIFQVVANEKGLELVVACASHVPGYISGDENRLKQVLNNLLSNALKFTHQGSVSLIVSSECKEHRHFITFSVKDTGIGMSREQVSRVFEKFTQADSSTTRRYGGTGLGLAISRQLVALMGGNINVESELTQGTEITLTLPFAEGAAKDYAETSVAPLSEAKFEGAVLVVEDNQVNQYVIKAMLDSLGCEVTVAENGLEALGLLQQTTFDLVLMDMQMPEMDGVEATRHIRKLARSSSVPIVALTANALVSDRERCLEAGMNDFLLKPVTKNQLTKLLAHFLH